MDEDELNIGNKKYKVVGNTYFYINLKQNFGNVRFDKSAVAIYNKSREQGWVKPNKFKILKLLFL